MTHFNQKSQFAALFFLTVLTFINFPQTFFQQDEWQFFGAAISALSSSHPILETILPFGGQLTHFYPLAKLLFLSEYIFFDVNFKPFAIVSFALHLACAVAVYVLIKKLTRREFFAFLVTALFLINSFSHQALTWVLAGVTTLPATLFLILSLIFFWDYREFRKQKYLILSVSSLLISLLFKEIAFFLFLFILPIIFFDRKNFPKIKQPIIFLVTTSGLYILLRLIFLIFNLRSPQPEPGDMNMPPFTNFIFRIISVPIKGIAQDFFPQKFLINISDKLVHLSYPQFIGLDGLANQQIVQTIVFDMVCLFLTTLILIACFLSFRYFKKINDQKLSLSLSLALFFLTASFFPYIFIPGRVGYFSIFEPRNLYIGGIAASLLIVLFTYSLANILTKSKVNQKILTVIFLVPLLLMHILQIKLDLNDLEKTGQIRESLLTTIQRDYPDLPEKTVIFTKSNKSYYGMPEDTKILPIQSGFGRMVMVWYQKGEKFPGCLYEQQFLHDLLSEGYKYCQGRGFGYFRNLELMNKALKENKLLPQNIIAYEWDGNSNTFLNITQNIREKTQGNE